ncbi:hypothetical protein [Streptomyces otsuchiensis]|uniref:hypothetical protein n=1 Tax=Streptomyces otsuchiensis TaxID=2681388 RepID=UPI0010320F5F|nr:hypothetical protein [Streptomyces otsuchiensis]
MSEGVANRWADPGRRARLREARSHELRRRLAARYRKLTGDVLDVRWLSLPETDEVLAGWNGAGPAGEFSLTALGPPGASVWLASGGEGGVALLGDGHDPDQPVTLLFRHYWYTGAAVARLGTVLARGLPMACADEDGFVAVLAGGRSALSVDCDEGLDTVEVQLWGEAAAVFDLPDPE